MKKIFLFLAVAALMNLTACQKDGVFKPGRKIAEIQSRFDDEEFLSDKVFHWDGNKLTSVTVVNNIDGNDLLMEMTYDGKQLVKMSSSSTVTMEDGSLLVSENKVLFDYDGRKLSKVVEIYSYTTSNGIHTVTEEDTIESFDVEHDGKHISKIVSKQEISWWKADFRLHKQVLNMLMPKSVADRVLAQEKNAAKSGLHVHTISYTWDGDNISSVVTNDKMFVDGEVDSEENSTANYTYDDRKNPLHGFVMGFEGIGCWSENNVLTESGLFRDEPYTINYTYEYDGKYPTLCTQTLNENSYSEKYIYE